MGLFDWIGSSIQAAFTPAGYNAARQSAEDANAYQAELAAELKPLMKYLIEARLDALQDANPEVTQAQARAALDAELERVNAGLQRSGLKGALSADRARAAALGRYGAAVADAPNRRLQLLFGLGDPGAATLANWSNSANAQYANMQNAQASMLTGGLNLLGKYLQPTVGKKS